MSHQDLLHDTAQGEQLQHVIEELLPRETFEDLRFQAGSLWTPLSLAFTAILWSWSGEQALTERFAQAQRILGQQRDWPAGVSYQGFLKRLQCWHEKLCERLKSAFRRRMSEDPALRGHIAGWLILAADGSRCETPRTRSNQRRFAAKKKPPKNPKAPKTKKTKKTKQSADDRAKKAATPQIWLTALYVVPLGLPWDWRRGPTGSSEREHLQQMLDTLPRQTILTLDAGFVGYELWQALRDVRFVCRVGSNVKLLKDLGEVRSQEGLVFVWPDRFRRRGAPPMVLRLECFHDGREPLYLVTNVLDPQQLAPAEMQTVYRARWGVEMFYRDLKQTFERGKLRSKTAEHALLELDWSLLGLWGATLAARQVQARSGADPPQRSVARVLRALRRSMWEYATVPAPGQDLASRLGTAVRDTYVRRSCKASLDYPRQKTRRAPQPPRLISATPEQLEAASKYYGSNHHVEGLTA